jgi:hypothetical protein
MAFSRYRGHVPELSCGGLTAGSATTGTVLSAITKEAMKRCSGQVNGEAGRSTAGLQRCAAIIMDGAAGERWLSHDIKDTFLQKGFPRAFYDPDEYQKLTPDVIAEFREGDEYLPESAKSSGYTTLLTVLARKWSRAQVDAILGRSQTSSRGIVITASLRQWDFTQKHTSSKRRRACAAALRNTELKPVS